MTRKLEETLNLAPMEDFEEDDVSPKERKEKAIDEIREIKKELSNSKKIDLALVNVSDLDEHEEEMDEIAFKAMKSYKDLIDLGMDSSEIHGSKMFEVAATFLKTALDAKDSKINKKLKILELQMKKMKMDNEKDPEDEHKNTNDRLTRAELLAIISKGSSKE